MRLDLTDRLLALRAEALDTRALLPEGEMVSAEPSFVPTSNVTEPGVYEVWFPTSMGDWVMRDVDGALVRRESLLDAQFFQDDLA